MITLLSHLFIKNRDDVTNPAVRRAYGQLCGMVGIALNLASDYRFGRATHGYMPDYGPQPVFVAKGPAIREGVELGRGRVIDEAPTFAKIIGQTLPQADGKPIDEILK